MVADRSAQAEHPGFVHQVCLYHSDDEFLAMAVPFIEDGLAGGEPVLAVTTSANLDLLRSDLGEAAHGLDYAETSYFGRRPAQRVAAFDRYWKRHTFSAGNVRILAEPVWTGRSEPEIRAWKQMEAGLNLVFADTRICMICPYDSRILRPDIIADACRTHPARVEGREQLPCVDYADPEIAARSFGAELTAPPVDAAAMTFTGDMSELRAFVVGAAAAHGLTADHCALFAIAAAEAAGYLRRDGLKAAVAIWERPGAVVCNLHQPGGGRINSLLGLRPPDLDEPRTGDGLWLTRQVSESVQTQSDNGGRTIRLEMPTARAMV